LRGIGESGKEVGEFLVGPIQHIAGEQAAAGTEFEDFDFRRAVERLPYLVELTCEQASEDSVNVARGIEVSGFAELFVVGGVVTMRGIVEADLHVA
jgi:predicted polyphosphate/ATP-dependent NAD kinase